MQATIDSGNVGTEMDTASSDEQREAMLKHKAKIAAMAIKRERQLWPEYRQMRGSKELPHVLRCLARVYDFQNGRMLDKPREAAVNPVAAIVAKPKVPDAPREMDTRLQNQLEYQRQQRQQQQQQQPSQPNPNSLRRYVYDRYFRDHKGPKKTLPGSNMGRQNSKKHERPPPRKSLAARLQCKPYIVVPTDCSSLVNLFNVQNLLQELHYVPSIVKKRIGKPNPEDITIVRNCRGDTHNYRAIDNVANLTKEEWDLVVAVFVVDPYTQFAGWPAHGNAEIICRHVCAFHLHFIDDTNRDYMESLGINLIGIPENDRTRDMDIIMQFWNKLDHHVATYERIPWNRRK